MQKHTCIVESNRYVLFSFQFWVLIYQGVNLMQVTVNDTLYTLASTFEDLNLSKELLKGLYIEMKFQKPGKIQAISLPMILTPPHKDLITQAHNAFSVNLRISFLIRFFLSIQGFQYLISFSIYSFLLKLGKHSQKIKFYRFCKKVEIVLKSLSTVKI